ncbi:dienelactone hydrolase family protein (plasmid) [Agrobacterium leguminum]|uniref:alpha/beta hydrolase n=1 Tax=Agrobacterium leguminum TaxID=2792015 RepID=UPI0030CF7CE0
MPLPPRLPGAFEVCDTVELGAEWRDAKGAIIALHGRDRPVGELTNLLSLHLDMSSWRIVAPTATGNSWYPGRYNDDPTLNAAGRNAGFVQIETAIYRCRQNSGPDCAIVLVGFSQGGCLVAEYLLSDKIRPGAAAIFTGAVNVPVSRSVFCRDICVLLTGGTNDPWLPLPDLQTTAEELALAGASVRVETFPDDEHKVRVRELELLQEICEELVAKRVD